MNVLSLFKEIDTGGPITRSIMVLVFAVKKVNCSFPDLLSHPMRGRKSWFKMIILSLYR